MAYGITALVGVLSLGLARIPAALIVIGPLFAAEGLLRLMSAPRFRAFDRQLMAALQEHRDDELLALYGRQRFLLWGGSRYQMLDKLGLIYAHLGNMAAAAEAYRDAFEEAPGKKQVEIAIKLADALRESGELEQAERMYRQIFDVTQAHAPTAQHLGRLIIQRHGDVREALEVLKRAEAAVAADEAGGALRAELALMLAGQGLRDEGREILKKARANLAGSQDHLGLLEEAESALGQSSTHTNPATANPATASPATASPAGD